MKALHVFSIHLHLCYKISGERTSPLFLTDAFLWLHWLWPVQSKGTMLLDVSGNQGTADPPQALKFLGTPLLGLSLALPAAVCRTSPDIHPGAHWWVRINKTPSSFLCLKLGLQRRTLPAPRQEGGNLRRERNLCLLRTQFCPMRLGQSCWQLPLIPLGQVSGSWQLVERLRWGCWGRVLSEQLVGPYISWA